MDDLKNTTIKSLFWSSLERISVQVIQFIVAIILARILLPEDYGLIGMIIVFISISNVVVNSGFSQALIQKKDANEIDYNTVFIFNILCSILIYLILFSFSSLIADFYDEPILKDIVKVISLAILFSSLSIVQLAILFKKLDFKTVSKASLISVFFSGTLAIYLAVNDWGVWALVFQVVVKAIINSLLLFVFTKWKPKIIFSKNSFFSLFSFGSKLLVSGIINAVFMNLYYIIIGKFFSVRDLGFYTRADQLRQMPSETITSILQRVNFPVLSKIQNDDLQLVKYCRKFIGLAAFLNFPIMISLIVLSEPVILLLLTEKWIGATQYLELLCLVGLVYPLHAINLNLLKVKGRSDLFLNLEILRKAIIIIAVIVTIPYGILTLIYGQVICAFLFLIPNTFYTKKMINYGLIKQLKDLTPYFSASIIMGFFMRIILNLSLTNHMFLNFLIVIFSGAVIYFILAILFKIHEVNYIKKFFNYEQSN